MSHDDAHPGDACSPLLWGMQELWETYCKLPLDESSVPPRLFWTLFLVAKSRLLPQFPDLVTGFSLLIAVFSVALAHFGPEHCAVSFEDQEHFPQRTPSGSADLPESLIQNSKANSAMVRMRFLCSKRSRYAVRGCEPGLRMLFFEMEEL